MKFKEFETKLNRNYLRELVQKKQKTNLDIAANSIAPRLNKTFFVGMISFSCIFAFAEYFDLRKVQSEGNTKLYDFGVSIESAFIIWTILGIIVLLCCAVEFYSWQQWQINKIKNPRKVLLDKDNATEEELKEEQEAIKKEKAEEEYWEIEKNRIRKYSIVTSIGIAILGITNFIV